MRKIRAGFVGFGEVNTPKEFIGDRCRAAADLLQEQGMEVFEAGPVADDPAGADAARAIAKLSPTKPDSSSPKTAISRAEISHSGQAGSGGTT